MKKIFISFVMILISLSIFSCGSSVRITNQYIDGLDPKPSSYPIDIFKSDDKKPYETVEIAEIKCSSDDIARYSFDKEYVEKLLWDKIKSKARKLGGDAVIYYYKELEGIHRGGELLSGNIYIRGYIVKKKEPEKTKTQEEFIKPKSDYANMESGTSLLEFDGIYQSKESFTKLRFYKDGTVIGVSTIGDPLKIFKWFNREAKSVSRGIYEFKNGRLTFSLTSDEGIIDYEGEIKDEKLILDSYSHINERRFKKRKYSFIQITETKEEWFWRIY